MKELRKYLENEIMIKNQLMEEIFYPEEWDMDSRIEWERLEESVFVLEEVLLKISSEFLFSLKSLSFARNLIFTS